MAAPWLSRLALLGASSWAVLGCSDRPAPTSGVARQVGAFFGRSPESEIEPNGNAAQANNLGDDVVIRANVRPGGDEDFYRFTARPGDRIYAAIQTASSSASDDVTSDLVEIPPDSLLDVIDASGTILETDDDNGSMAERSSSIAGLRIPAQGAYTLRVRKKGGGELRPYDLYFRRREGSPSAEAEGNDDTTVASRLPASGWVSGSIADGDVDVYSLGVGSGSVVFASLDLDPERDGVEWDGILEFGPFEGSFLRVNDQTQEDAPSSEALFATVQNTGDYYVRVSPAGTGVGSYALSVSVLPRNFECESWFQQGSSDVPKEIPDGPGRTTSTISLGQSGALIRDLDVGIDIVHSQPQDLDVHLISPAGNDIVLFTDVGSDAFPHLGLTIDDEGAFPITPANDAHFRFTDQTALSNLVVQPEVSSTLRYRTATRLGWLDGEDPAGTWTLVVDDDSPGNSGVLRSWGLRVCEQRVPETCPNGDALMFALDATFERGNHDFRLGGSDEDDVNNQWFWARPQPYSGFNGCYRGDQCWKTNADGNYASNSKQTLVSPPIDLADAVPPIRVSWAMKYQLESATYDHAWVDVRERGGANRQRLWEFLDATMEEFVGDESAPENVVSSAGWGYERRISVPTPAGPSS